MFRIARSREFADDNESTQIMQFIQDDISEDANIEGFLTHLADFISMSERSRTGNAQIGEMHVSKDKLVSAHNTLLRIIAEIVQWGYRPVVLGENGEEIEAEDVGKIGHGIVTVDKHQEFIQANF